MSRIVQLLLMPLFVTSCVKVQSVSYAEGIVPPRRESILATEAKAVPEVWRTQAFPKDNIDSVAVWRNAEGTVHLLISTSKAMDRLLLFDASNGEFIRAVGSSGSEAGQFARPNEIVVRGNHVFVVEGENRRVQVLKAPEMTSVGSFGTAELIKPRGLDVVAAADGSMAVYVTDDYQRSADQAEALPSMGKRVKVYQIEIAGNAITATFDRSFGNTTEAGALLKVNSILADPETGLLFIGDEDRDDVKIYTLDGNFTGRTLGTDTILEESGGIAILPHPDAPEGGLLVVTEQRKGVSRFHIYSRRGTQHLGVITADPRIANTDGITIVPGDFGHFRHGALIAVHNDESVVGINFADIMKSIGLHESETTR